MTLASDAARIDRTAGFVYLLNETFTPEPILSTVGHLIVHVAFGWDQRRYAVTAPCGYALGTYRQKDNACEAARILGEMLKNPTADSLSGLFGGPKQGRAAFDAVHRLMS